jgi:hypothetical protein
MKPKSFPYVEEANCYSHSRTEAWEKRLRVEELMYFPLISPVLWTCGMIADVFVFCLTGRYR